MRTIALWVMGLATTATAMGAPTCRDEVLQQRAASPVADERPIPCVRREVPEGSVDDCAAKAFLLTHIAKLVALVKEDKYNNKFITKALTDPYNNLTDLAAGAISAEALCEAVANYNAATPQEEKDRKLLGDRWTVSRNLTDSTNPATPKKAKVPAVMTVVEDRVKDKTTATVYGTLAYNAYFDPVAWTRWDLSLAVDSSTADPVSKSSVTLAAPLTKSFANPEGIVEGVDLSISPQFQTDRAFDRRAYQLIASASFLSTRLGRMGQFTCMPVIDCSSGENAIRFMWTPKLGYETGRVDDAGRNANLAIIKQQGTYSRLVPSVAVDVYPEALSDNLSFQLAYRHRYDLKEGWDRGYGEVSMLYAMNKDKTLFLVGTYRKGRKDLTFDPIDSVLLGFGYLQQ